MNDPAFAIVLAIYCAVLAAMIGVPVYLVLNP